MIAPLSITTIFARLLVLAFVTCSAIASPDGSATFDVRKYGATGNGTVMDTKAIQDAIDAAANAGGGNVVFIPGNYLSASIHIKSHVTLWLEKGATLLGSPHRSDYEKLNFYALILADNQEDLGIGGPGTIDGQGEQLVEDTRQMMPQRNPPYADETNRPFIINFSNCKKIDIRDITLRQSSCWTQHYHDCEQLTIENITVRTMAAITNDGIDLDGCSHAVVRGCDIDSEDDGICFKSHSKACEDILVENCRIRSTCNALKFGTASRVGFKNITCRNLEIYDTYLSAIALEIVDGGTMENIRISNIKITTAGNPLFIRLGHRNANQPPGVIRDVEISDVTAEVPNRPRTEMNKFPKYWKHACRTLITASITGVPEGTVRDITLRNFTIRYGGAGVTPEPDKTRLKTPEGVPELVDRYPESVMFERLPAWGLYCRHVEGLHLENVNLDLEKSDDRPALYLNDVKKIVLNRFHSSPQGGLPAIFSHKVEGVKGDGISRSNP